MALQSLLPSALVRTAGGRVRIGDVEFGGPKVAVIAGPCSVERDYLDHARAAAAAGADVLRGCVYKPRTRPDSFQGMGVAGLPLLAAARRATGLPVVAEPLCPEHVELLRDHVDALQIGARSMQNSPLLVAAGRTGLPVILKRAPAATYDEWLSAADYILAEGNDQVILCERGIRSFEPSTRNTLDIGAITVLRERTALPVIVDPSHAVGRRDWVPSLALAAVSAGADGLLIESHPLPREAWSDADQAITPAVLRQIVLAVLTLAPLVRTAEIEVLEGVRLAIDGVDALLGTLLERRAALVAHAQARKAGLPERDPGREHAVVARVAAHAPSLGLAGAEQVMRAVIDSCLSAAGKEADAA